MRSRSEYTLVNRDQDEVMVVVEGDRHVIDVYTYRDARFLDDMHRLVSDWRPGKNRMFVHAANPRAAIGFLRENNFMLVGEDVKAAPDLLMWAA